MNNMAGVSAVASSRKKTTVEAHARDKAVRAPNRSANLPKKTDPTVTFFYTVFLLLANSKEQCPSKK